MSFILTEDIARRAVAIARPTIEEVLGSDLVDGRANLHLVVLDPDNGRAIYEESFGDKATWQHPYDKIAQAKASLCWHNERVGRSIQNDAPWLYERGDTRYAGGVFENGLVVAASGLQDYFDEMISWMVVSAIQALCRDVIAKIPDDAPDFFR